MEEKIITGHKNGMLVLLLTIVLYLAAVAGIIFSVMAQILPLTILCIVVLSSAGSHCAACAF